MTIPPPPLPPPMPATPSAMPIKTEKLGPGFIVGISILGTIFACLIFVMIYGSSPKVIAEETLMAGTAKLLTETIQPSKTFIPTKTTKPTKTPLLTNTQEPTFTPTPILLLKTDEGNIEGVSISVTKVDRSLISNFNLQNVSISYRISTTNTYWTGFDFQSDELILDFSGGKRVNSVSITDPCLVYDNQTCNATATFQLPLDVTQVDFYYVSDRRTDNLRPIEVNTNSERRFIATINLSAIYLPPTITPTPTQTLTITPTYTLTPLISLTPTKTIVPTKTDIPSKTPIPPIELFDIYDNFEHMTTLQFTNYKNSIMGKKISENVIIGNVDKDGAILLNGPWNENSIMQWWDFCVVLKNVPINRSQNFSGGDLEDITASIYGWVGNNNYYINCENTLLLNFVKFND